MVPASCVKNNKPLVVTKLGNSSLVVTSKESNKMANFVWRHTLHFLLKFGRFSVKWTTIKPTKFGSGHYWPFCDVSNPFSGLGGLDFTHFFTYKEGKPFTTILWYVSDQVSFLSRNFTKFVRKVAHPVQFIIIHINDFNELILKFWWFIHSSDLQFCNMHLIRSVI